MNLSPDAERRAIDGIHDAAMGMAVRLAVMASIADAISWDCDEAAIRDDIDTLLEVIGNVITVSRRSLRRRNDAQS